MIIRRRPLRAQAAAAFALASLSALPFLSASATAVPPVAVDHLYVTGAGSDQLLGYAVGDGVDPQPAAGAPYPTGFGTLSVKSSADHRFLYVITVTPVAAIHAYAIGGGGALTPVPGSPVPVPEAPLGMNVSPDGKHLVLTTGPSTDGGAHLRAYSIGPDGALSPGGEAVGIGPAGTLSGGPVPMPVVSPDNLNVYVANYAGGYLTRFELRADSSLSPARESTRTGGGPVSPTFSPDGAYLYTANEHTSSVSVFRQDAATGALAEVPGSPFAASGLTPHGIGLSPDGRYLYTPDAMTNDVTGFEVLPGGALRTLPGSPYAGGAAGTMPGQVFVSGDGRRLYAVDLFGTEPIPAVTLRSYHIAPDGTLTPGGSAPLGTGQLFSAASLLVPGR